MSARTIQVVAIICPHCADCVWSRHVHDMRPCFCGYCYIDGGRSYTRSGWGGSDWPKPWKQPEMVTIKVRAPTRKEIDRDTFPY